MQSHFEGWHFLPVGSLASVVFSEEIHANQNSFDGDKIREKIHVMFFKKLTLPSSASKEIMDFLASRKLSEKDY